MMQSRAFIAMDKENPWFVHAPPPPGSYLISLCYKDSPPSFPQTNRRVLALHPNDVFILGRASKNQRSEFIAKTTNAYFENAVVSRNHAKLSNLFGQVSDHCILYQN
jgi:hypothetical protein